MDHGAPVHPGELEWYEHQFYCAASLTPWIARGCMQEYDGLLKPTPLPLNG
jgi:hypothetical protein